LGDGPEVDVHPNLILIFLSVWFKLRGCQSCWASITAQSVRVMTELFIYSPCTWPPATYSVSRLITWEPPLSPLNVFQKPGSSENGKPSSSFHSGLGTCQTTYLPPLPAATLLLTRPVDILIYSNEKTWKWSLGFSWKKVSKSPSSSLSCAYPIKSCPQERLGRAP